MNGGIGDGFFSFLFFCLKRSGGRRSTWTSVGALVVVAGDHHGMGSAGKSMRLPFCGLLPLCHCFKGNQLKVYNVACGNNTERKTVNEVDGAYKRERQRRRG